MTRMKDIEFDFARPIRQDPNQPANYYDDHEAVINCYISDYGLLPANFDRIVKPQDYERIGDYGLVYIYTHGGGIGIYASLYTSNHPAIENWFRTQPKENYYWEYKHLNREQLDYYFPGPTIDDVFKKGIKFRVTVLEYKSFFAGLNAHPDTDFKNSIIFMSTCRSFQHAYAFSSAALYLSYDGPTFMDWQAHIGYYLFHYMLFGHNQPLGMGSVYDPTLVYGDPPYPQDVPLSAEGAFRTLEFYYKVNKCFMNNGLTTHLNYSSNTDKEIYFPAPAQIIVHKK